MKKLLIAMSVSASALASMAVNSADYVIDTQGAHASVNFKVKHLGYSWLTGRFNTFEGSFEWDKENPAASSVAVSIDTTSLDSNHAERDKHLRSGDFLEVSKYPTASFKSTAYKPTGEGTGELTGELSLRGVTSTITFPVEQIGEGDDPWGGYRAGFSGSTSIMLGDYGMGGPLGNIPVELELNVEGVRQ
ncbi:YceI family protein [Parahaliea maris]|uniref:YceI family protein n=1 Tax=Parahaliea maris TaxID=2716870 RepID=A0A5C9A567_9GAMM|nr:YceI family protein [Parahaliea maris]TXS95948.1 YceI family protein [Parahaliea maris]